MKTSTQKNELLQKFSRKVSQIKIDASVFHIKYLPTGSVKVECSPPERKVVSSSHSRVIPKT